MCDSYTAVAAVLPEEVLWTIDELTMLCTETCRDSLSVWIESVDTACGNNPIVDNGIIKLASSVPLTYKEGFDLVCLKEG